MGEYLMGKFDQSCVWHSFPSCFTNLFLPFLSSFHGKTHYCVRAAGVKPCDFTNRLTAWLVSAVVAGYGILFCFPFHVRVGEFFWSQSVTSCFCHTLQWHPTSSPCRHWDFSRTQASQINSNNFWRKAENRLLHVENGADRGFFLAGSSVPAEEGEESTVGRREQKCCFSNYPLLTPVICDLEISRCRHRYFKIKSTQWIFLPWVYQGMKHPCCRMMAGSFTCCRLNQNCGVRAAFPTLTSLLMFSVACFSLTPVCL